MKLIFWLQVVINMEITNYWIQFAEVQSYVVFAPRRAHHRQTRDPPSKNRGIFTNADFRFHVAMYLKVSVRATRSKQSRPKSFTG